MRLLLPCLLLLVTPAPAQLGDTLQRLFGPAGDGVPCTTPAHREFGFWLGAWAITQADGTPGGHSQVSEILGGCAQLETYVGGQQQGLSLSAYRMADQQWIQTYVDRTGLTLRLVGAYTDGRMHLADAPRSIPSAGLTLRSDVTWTPRANGSVRQFWRLSRDGGRTWGTSFDGTYARAGSAVAPPSTPSESCGSTGTAYRALDAMLGEWLVEDGAGPPLGRSRVEVRLGGCLAEERYEGKDGYEARRLVAFDRYLQEWLWLHVDTRGHVERLAARGTALPLRFVDELKTGPGLCLDVPATGPVFRRGGCGVGDAHVVRYRRATTEPR